MTDTDRKTPLHEATDEPDIEEVTQQTAQPCSRVGICFKSCAQKWEDLSPDSKANNIQLFLLVIGIVIGFVCAILIQLFGPAPPILLKLIELPGTLLLNIIRSLVVFLIPTSIICGIASLDISQFGRIGCRALTFYMATTILASASGIIWVSILKPGAGFTPINQTIEHVTDPSAANSTGATIDIVIVMFHDLFPPNYVTAAVDFNFLGLITASVAIGIAIVSAGQKAKPVLDILVSFNELLTIILKSLLWVIPIGVCFLIMFFLGTSQNMAQNIAALGKFVLCVCLASFAHLFIVLPLIYVIFTRRNPLLWVKGMLSAIITAFGTASSLATLPVTTECCLNQDWVHPSVVKFMLPLGATVNMDGGALYEGITAIFVAQSVNRPIDITMILMVFLLATFMSIGAPGIPSVGLTTVIIVLTTLKLPLDSVGMLVTVEWFLDRIRTSVNVFGDTVGVAVVSNSLDFSTDLDEAPQDDGQGQEPQNDIDIKLDTESESDTLSSSHSNQDNKIN